MPVVITSRAIAREASKFLAASPLQTMSRSVTIPTSRSSSPTGMQPMSCAFISLASSVTGVSGATQSTPLCITSFTFMADLRCLSFQWNECNAAQPPLADYTAVQSRRHGRAIKTKWAKASQIVLKVLRRDAERLHRLIEIIRQHWRADQIGRSAVVVGLRGLRPQIAETTDLAIAAAEPHQGDQIDLLVDIEAANEVGKLGAIGSTPAGPRPKAGVVIGKIGHQFGLVGLDLGLPRLGHDEKHLFR